MLFILNKSMEVVESLNDRGNMSKITPYFDDEYVQDLSTGAETLTFSTLGNSVQSQHLVVGNFVAFRYDDDYKLFNIINIDEEHTDVFIKHVYCEMASIELINEIVRPMKFRGTVRQFIDTILEDTSWQLGTLDMGFTETVDLDISDYKSVYSLLQEHIVNSFKGEMTYRVDIANNEIVGKYVDVYKKRGMDRGVRFSYNKNITSIKKTVDSSNLATALIGVGKNNITFKELDLPDKPAGQDFIADDYAYRLWNIDGKHILGTHKEDTDSPQELLKLTRLALKERSTPNIKYEMRVELLGEQVKIGDTVKIVDHEFNPPLYLEGRINQLKISRTDSSRNECVLANFKEIGTNISAELKELAGYIDSQFPIGGEKIKDGAIDGDKLANGQIIKGTHLFANSITADKIKADSIDTKHLKTGSITAEKAIIADGAIGSAQIADGVIDTVHIKSGAIDTININEGAITSAKIGDAQVGTIQVADGAITNAKIGQMAVDTANIKDASITNAKIKDLSADKITVGTIDADRIASSVIQAINMSVSGRIDASKINVGDLTVESLDAGKITTGTLDADRIKSSVISAINASLETATIDSAKIGAIDAGKITTGSIDADRIKTSVIQAINLSTEKISADRIEALDLKVKNIDAKQITTGTIDAERMSASIMQAIALSAGKIKAENIDVNGIRIGNANIVDGTILGSKITKGTITNAEIAIATITDANIKEINANKITAGTIDANKVTINNLKADSIVAGSITVEGNNLIHNTAFEKDLDLWVNNTKGWEVDNTTKFEGVNTAKISKKGATEDFWCELLSESVQVTQGESFVGSLYIKTTEFKAPDDMCVIYLWGYSETGQRFDIAGATLQENTNTFKKIVVTGIVPEGAKYIRFGISSKRNGTVNVAKPMLSKGTIASVWKKHNDELISSGAITNEKIAQQAITSDKLVIDEIWASEGFINNFQAQSIDAGQIKTGKITGDRIDIEGMISFADLNPELSKNFITPKDSNGNSLSTWINGANIYTGTLTGEQINTRGFTATNQLGLTTFNIDKNTGDVSMSGMVKSSNYSDIKGQETGYMLTPDGDAYLNNTIVRGSVILPNSGIADFNKNTKGANLLINGSASLSGTSPTNKPIGNLLVDINELVDKTVRVSLDVDATGLKKVDGQFNRIGYEMGVTLEDNTSFYINCWLEIDGKFTDYSNRITRLIKVPNKKIKSINYSGLYIQCAGSKILLSNPKIEFGEGTNEWTPSIPFDNPTRIWAGASYENRDKAPFRVLQDGSVIATKGNFGGTITGKLNIGNIVIEDTNTTNGYIDIKNNDDSKTLIHLEEENSYIKSNLAIGDSFTNFDTKNKTLFVAGKYKLANGNYSTIMNDGGVIMQTTDGKGLHQQFYWDGCLNFSSNGNQSNKSDFRFEKNHGKTPVKLDVMGELYAKDKITMNNNIAIVARQDAGNSGFDYVVN